MKCFCGNDFMDFDINNEPFFLCEKCGYLRKKNIPNKEEEKERYDHHICDLGYQKYMEGVMNRLMPNISGKCLDFGCGKIHALADLLNSQNIPCDYYDLYYYPEFPKGKFDTILLIEVFEHILDSKELLLSLKDLLNENGKIIIMTQKKKYPLETWWYLRDITHISFVDCKTMEELAKIVGLRVKEEEGYFVFF